MDLFHINGHIFLIMVDKFSGYPFMTKHTRTTTKDITNTLEGWFDIYGYPRAIRSDNGPQFWKEFSVFCKNNAIVHETASPYHPESNGIIES